METPTNAQSNGVGSHRLRILRISSDLFTQLFTADSHPAYEVMAEAIPRDAVIRNVRMGWLDAAGNGQMEIMIESAEFEPLQDGQPIPYLTPVLRRVEWAERGLIVACDA